MRSKKKKAISIEEKELIERLKNSTSKDKAFNELVNGSKKNLYFQFFPIHLSL